MCLPFGDTSSPKTTQNTRGPFDSPTPLASASRSGSDRLPGHRARRTTVRTVPDASCAHRARRTSRRARSCRPRVFRNDAFERLRGELGGAKPFDEMTARVSSPSTATSRSTASARRSRSTRARRLRHLHSLRGDGQLRFAARQRRRSQPARPGPHRVVDERARVNRSSRCRLHVLRGR